jgi:hypothetical protein
MKFSLTCALIVFAISANAQKTALTEQGETVILYPDGTWKFRKSDENASGEIPLNAKRIFKPEDATFQVKSKSVQGAAVWISPKLWSFENGKGEDAAEYEFTLRNEDAYGMMIAEGIEIPILSLRDIAVENARNAAPDLEIIEEEYRMVNGIKVLSIQMNGTIRGSPFSYLNYYYSSKSGSIQLLTYTSSNLFSNYRSRMEKLLNGLVCSE